MEIGLMLRFGEQFDPPGRSIGWNELRDLARQAEAVGFDTLSTITFSTTLRRWSGREPGRAGSGTPGCCWPVWPTQQAVCAWVRW
jgi:hypothetical protein